MSLAPLFVRVARPCAVSLVALSLIASALPASHAPDSHHPPSHGVVAHTAGIEFQSLWALVVFAWNALRAQPEICQDCNLPVDGGCRCPCYSGGYDPSSPDCQ